jgi:V8-like Glu-specific endopeptidase
VLPASADQADPTGQAAHFHSDTERLLFGVTRVLTFSGTRQLTGATGFLFQRDDRLYLVSSRHVFIDTPSGHQPDRIEIVLHGDTQDLTRCTSASIPLYWRGQAAWHQAGDTGGDIDVAAIELATSIAETIAQGRRFGMAQLATSHDDLAIGDPVVIPGYPLGFYDTVHQLPVTRSGTVASAYGIRFQGKGFFLTDSRTHRGSSGAPVLARRRDPSGDRGWRLVGIHSSRLDMSSRDALLDESLGLNCAWYADVLLTLTERPPAATPPAEA